MSDLRQDPITGQWVVNSKLRAVRPNEFRQVETRRSDLACPFCLGFERNTPPPICQLEHPLEPDRWIVRVVPNKYPALAESVETIEYRRGPYQQIQAGGIQEIVIQSPRHVASFSQLTDEELDFSMKVYQQRLAILQNDALIKHLMLFTNCRSEAGASLEHIHSQIIGTPIISPNLEKRLNLARQQFAQTGRSTMATIVDWEMEQGERIICAESPWVVFCPFASRFPFQVWIAPEKSEPSFAHCSDSGIGQLGRLIREVVDRLERIHDFPAYNVMFHIADNARQFEKQYQWYVEIVPRLTRFAGYELGTGCWINHIPPDDAARQLRQLPSNFEAP